MMALLPLVLSLACDILNPETRGPEDLLRYVQRAQQRAQLIQRLWPELAPLALTASPAFGAPDLDYETLAATVITRTADLPAQVTEGSTITCDEDTCIIVWSVGDQARTFVRAEYRDGRASRFVQRVTDPPFGTWLTWFDASGRSTAGTLLPEGSSPISVWNWQRATAGFSGSISQPGSAFGAWEIRGETLIGQSDVSPLRTRFPWRAWPVSTSVRLAPRSWERVVQYGNDTSTFVMLDTSRPAWQWQGPGVADTGAGQGMAALTCVTVFDIDQLLLRIETTIERGATETTVTELQVNRLGARTEFVLHVAPTSIGTRTFWFEDGRAAGGTDVFVDGPGWRVDAFWDLVDGSLITLQARVFPTGLWSGTFSGWAREDQNDPREQGEFLMLPDGSWSANVLLRQTDGSFAELPLALPPEGATARSVE